MKKRVDSLFKNSGSIFAAAVVAVFVFTMCADAQNVIVIRNIDDLSRIGSDASFPVNGSYELNGDINASKSRTMHSGTGFTPIGSSRVPFIGTFNGKGFTIRGLYINRPENDNIGLFGVVGANGRIRNVNLVADSIIGKNNVGGLAGSIIATSFIDSSSSAGAVKGVGDNNVGGLVGSSKGATINNSSSAAIVGGEGNFVGGLVGNSDNTLINRCYSTGTVKGTTHVGGLVGRNHSNTGTATITNCYATGSVDGVTNVGGLVGTNQSSTGLPAGIVNCYSTGSVTAASTSFIGGFLGTNGNTVFGTITSSFWDTEASGRTASAGTGSTGRTTVQMMTEATYTNWDFTAIWGVNAGNNYPYLRALPFHTVTYAAGANGTVSGGPLTQTANPGVFRAVTAAPNATYRFVSWSDGVTTAQRHDFSFPASTNTITANFAGENQFSLTYTADENGTIKGKMAQVVDAATNGEEVEAVPNAGYTFVKWSDNITTAIRTDLNVSANITVTATFEIKTYTLTYAAGEGGRLLAPSSSHSQVVAHGDNGVTVTASADYGYVFVKWSDDITTEARTDGNITADRTITAIFEVQASVLDRAGYNSKRPLLSIRAKTLNINAAPNTGVQVRVVDMRGRTAAKFNTNGSASFSLRHIPAGRYIVEAKRADGQKMTQSILLK